MQRQILVLCLIMARKMANNGHVVTLQRQLVHDGREEVEMAEARMRKETENSQSVVANGCDCQTAGQQ